MSLLNRQLMCVINDNHVEFCSFRFHLIMREMYIYIYIYIYICDSMKCIFCEQRIILNTLRKLNYRKNIK